ncbi:MAG: hypothetical protein WC676_02800 [Candidatus Omnitrophota bacterium]
MKDLLDKLSTYNLFNYLFPGVVFVVLGEAITDYSFAQQDVVLGFFLYYFIGLVVSRVGSLVVEPLLKWISFLKFVDYKDYVAATKKDERVELLSEVNNTYRTLCACFGLLALLKVVEVLGRKFSIPQGWELFILVFALLVIFLFSYKKQSAYVKKRVEANK